MKSKIEPAVMNHNCQCKYQDKKMIYLRQLKRYELVRVKIGADEFDSIAENQGYVS